MRNGRLSGSAVTRHSGTAAANRPAPNAATAKSLTKAESAVMELDAPAVKCGVRRVAQTHDGRKIGHVEPLETDPAVRLAASRRLNILSISRNAEARESNRTKGRRISQAQKQSATKRAKGKGKR
jgi:hypothetical protein